MVGEVEEEGGRVEDQRDQESRRAVRRSKIMAFGLGGKGDGEVCVGGWGGEVIVWVVVFLREWWRGSCGDEKDGVEVVLLVG